MKEPLQLRISSNAQLMLKPLYPGMDILEILDEWGLGDRGWVDVNHHGKHYLATESQLTLDDARLFLMRMEEARDRHRNLKGHPPNKAVRRASMLDCKRVSEQLSAAEFWEASSSE